MPRHTRRSAPSRRIDPSGSTGSINFINGSIGSTGSINFISGSTGSIPFLGSINFISGSTGSIGLPHSILR